MQHSNEISQELQLISPVLAGTGKLHAFKVPEGYFDGLAQQMLENLRAELALASGIRTPYVIPEGYFENLSISVHSRITTIAGESADELSTVAPVLRSIEKKTAFTVPAGYFDQPVVIPAETKSDASVVLLKGYKRWIQYAAAAMLGGVLVSGAFLFTDSKDYIRTEKPATGNVVSQNKSTVNGLNGEVVVSPGINTETVVKHPVIAKKVELLSDDELQNYLEENAPSESIQLLDDSLEETTGI